MEWCFLLLNRRVSSCNKVVDIVGQMFFSRSEVLLEKYLLT